MSVLRWKVQTKRTTPWLVKVMMTFCDQNCAKDEVMLTFSDTCYSYSQ